MSINSLLSDDAGARPLSLELSTSPAAVGATTAALAAPHSGALGWSYLERFISALAGSLRAHSVFMAIIAAHAAAAVILPPLFGLRLRYSPTYYGLTWAFLTGVALIVFGVTYATIVRFAVRPQQFGRYIWTEATTKLLTPERVAMALPVFVCFPVFAATFSFFKTAIPAFAPFSWDPMLAEWDRVLHGGYQPWELLQPLLGHPYVTAAINGGYHLWFGVTYGVILWQMVDTRRPRLRMQYLITFLLLWILVGNLGATLLSSAGPVYYGRVTGLPDPYAPLMAYLHGAAQVVSVPALEVQDLLWRAYHDGLDIPGAGISAMPSMHLAIAFSFVLLGFATSRMFGVVFSVFAAVILIGSVHLGWHYAIDGYAAILVAWAIWRAVGWFLDRPGAARFLQLDRGPPAALAG